MNHLATLPSMILGHAASGLPSSLSCAAKISFCLSTAALLTCSLPTTIGFIAATCIATLSTKPVSSALRGPLGVDEHRELAARVHVGVHEAAGLARLERRPAPDDHVLARLGDELGADLVDRLVGAGALLSPEVAALRRLGGHLDDGLHEALEVVAAGDEVGLAVDLDDDSALAVGGDPRRDLALGRDATGARGGLDDPLLEDDLDGLLHVAVGLDERVLAVAMPAWVRSRSSLTIEALISAMTRYSFQLGRSPPSSRRPRPPRMTSA